MDWRCSSHLLRPASGRGCSSALGELPDHPLDKLALATPLGLGILALSCLMLGQFGWLNLAGLVVLLAVGTEIGLLAGFRVLRDLTRRSPRDSARQSITVVDRLMFVFLVLTLGATALSAMAPVTDGDALCYHLQVPKVFLIRQAVYFDPDLHETVYPLVTELLYAISLEFRGPVACRCLQWVLGLVFAAGVAALARPSLGAGPGGPPRWRSWCRRSATAWRLRSTTCRWPRSAWRRSSPGRGASTALRGPPHYWPVSSRAWPWA